jgi:hypothetical protein
MDLILVYTLYVSKRATKTTPAFPVSKAILLWQLDNLCPFPHRMRATPNSEWNFCAKCGCGFKKPKGTPGPNVLRM